jgi:aminoglycoside phosphotransferase (APT) family kinase protein
MKLHDGEVNIDRELVGRLVAAQFPQLADLPISAVQSTGTVNTIYRIGDHLCARLPRMQKWAQDLDREWHWLPKLAPRLSLRVPEPVGKGHPSGSYPFPWAIYGWINGQPYADELVDDEDQAAKDLAQFVVELRRIDSVVEAPRGGRKPLCELDAVTREAIKSANGVIDSDAATAAWEGHSKHRRGKEPRCGYTPTCSGPTCSFTAAGSVRSSTSAVSGSAIPPLT